MTDKNLKKDEHQRRMRVYFPTPRAKRVALQDLKSWFGTASGGVRQLIYEERRRRLKLDQARKELYED